MKVILLISGAVVLVLLAVMVSGWDRSTMELHAEAVVKANVYDPASAQFKNLIIIGTSDSKKRTVCGEVNAKNRFGGYVGYTPFIYREPSYGLIIANHEIAGQRFSSFDIEKACEQAKDDERQEKFGSSDLAQRVGRR